METLGLGFVKMGAPHCVKDCVEVTLPIKKWIISPPF